MGDPVVNAVVDAYFKLQKLKPMSTKELMKKAKLDIGLKRKTEAVLRHLGLAKRKGQWVVRQRQSWMDFVENKKRLLTFVNIRKPEKPKRKADVKRRKK